MLISLKKKGQRAIKDSALDDLNPEDMIVDEYESHSQK